MASTSCSGRSRGARDAAHWPARSAARRLIALRERELGLVDDGYGQRARALLIGAPNLPNWLSTLLDIIAVLPASVGGITRTPTSDLDLDRARVLRANRAAWDTQAARARADRRARRVRLAGVHVRRDRVARPDARRDRRAGGDVQGHAAHRLQAGDLPRHRARAAAGAARRATPASARCRTTWAVRRRASASWTRPIGDSRKRTRGGRSGRA